MLLKKIIAVVKECSKIILTAHNVENKITEKEGTANFVTDYDRQVQRMLQKKLSIPGRFFGRRRRSPQLPERRISVYR